MECAPDGLAVNAKRCSVPVENLEKNSLFYCKTINCTSQSAANDGIAKQF